MGALFALTVLAIGALVVAIERLAERGREQRLADRDTRRAVNEWEAAKRELDGRPPRVVP